MVLSMPNTSLEGVINIINEQSSLVKEMQDKAAVTASFSDDTAEGSNTNTRKVLADTELFSIDPAAFDSVEATCKYQIYLQKQLDEMERYVKLESNVYVVRHSLTMIISQDSFEWRDENACGY